LRKKGKKWNKNEQTKHDLEIYQLKLEITKNYGYGNRSKQNIQERGILFIDGRKVLMGKYNKEGKDMD
jgi:hypothetical protein